ncbi:MAG TPA: hypothetical protein DCF68_03585, partial [Cyanothece sp. UBA12306]|nr:hypothetical protein [Cyanothece sp. UBA12306]
LLREWLLLESQAVNEVRSQKSEVRSDFYNWDLSLALNNISHYLNNIGLAVWLNSLLSFPFKFWHTWGKWWGVTGTKRPPGSGTRRSRSSGR